MALVSVAPLGSKSWEQKSFISSTHHELKPLCRTIPTLRMCRRGKSFTPSVRMSLTTAVSDDGLQRRRGDYHSNLWDDDFIQSLSTPYWIDYTLEYGWHRNMPRLESRNYLDVFGHPTSPWLKKKRTQYLDSEKLLELAKLEFNIFHSLQQKELQYLSRWWIHSGLPELTFGRHRHVEYYTLSSCIATEPKHSAFRLGFAKTCHLITVLDDIYDTFGTMDEIELFNEAVRRWNPSEKERLPEYMREIYMALYEALTDMAREAEKTQGRDTLNYARKAWEVYLDSYTQEAKWIASGYLPTFEEYLENAKVSSGHRAAALTPLLTLDVPLPDDVLKGIDFPSRFNDLASYFLRLRGDTRCYKADRDRGEEASSISCYMRDNPGLTEEDALNHINAMINNIIKELNWELLKPDSNIPMTARKHAYEITRAFHQLYKYRDGFSVATHETKSLVRRTVLEPVPL